MAAKGVLRTIGLGERLGFHCPACNQMHVVTVAPAPHAWGFNGDYERPTFTPSVLVTWPANVNAIEEFKEWRTERRCHSFVENGEIRFLDDCTHALAGKTVPLASPAE
jgi:hypothetical protein